MLGMMSQQIEIAMIEPFQKVRPATILADASVKGIVPMAVPTQVSVIVDNPTDDPFTLVAGRNCYDSSGMIYVVTTPVTVAPGGTGTATLSQMQTVQQSFTVQNSAPFYQIPIVVPDEGMELAGISVSDSLGNQFTYHPDFVNVNPGDLVYTVEADEYQNVYVRFGYGGVVGYQPANGDVINIELTETNGDVTPAAASPFALQYTYTPQETQITMSLASVMIQGNDPMPIATLRELCKYPSIYDANAVYLGEFDFLIRRNYPTLQFLSVWNEQVEESVRGANVDNINVLFIACQPASGSSTSAVQSQIQATVQNADDSYGINFVTPDQQYIGVVVTGTIPRVYDPTSVTAQVNTAVLGQYGIDTPFSAAGFPQIRNKDLVSLLLAQVPALADPNSDFSVAITMPATTILPEMWMYVTAESLTVNITLAPYTNGSWGV
jgi:hypothetical protein